MLSWRRASCLNDGNCYAGPGMLGPSGGARFSASWPGTAALVATLGTASRPQPRLTPASMVPAIPGRHACRPIEAQQTMLQQRRQRNTKFHLPAGLLLQLPRSSPLTLLVATPPRLRMPTAPTAILLEHQKKE